jgi:hypothetical protein
MCRTRPRAWRRADGGGTASPPGGLNHPNASGTARRRVGTLGRRMRIIVAIVVVAALSCLLVAVQAKGCHYNVHLKTRLVCTG